MSTPSWDSGAVLILVNDDFPQEVEIMVRDNELYVRSLVDDPLKPGQPRIEYQLKLPAGLACVMFKDFKKILSQELYKLNSHKQKGEPSSDKET